MQREMIDLPDSMASLPRDERGYVVPKFVQWIDGKPDFRVIDRRHWVDCVKHRKCWLCGCHMGRRGWFVLGPMCTVNRINSEPPSHRLCAEFALKNCPFLTKPLAKRNERGLPESKAMPGIPVEHNPGMMVLWEATKWHTFRTNGGPLLEIDDCLGMSWWKEGRLGTPDEIYVHLQKGVDGLMAMAVQDGEAGMKALADRVFDTVRLMRRMGIRLPESVDAGT